MEKINKTKDLKKSVKKATAVVLALGMFFTGVFSENNISDAKKVKEKISLNYTSKKIEKGKTFTLKVKNLPNNIKSKKIKFSSSKKSIASVSSKGKVKGIKKGNTVIKCYISYKEKKKIKGKMKWVKSSKTLKCNVNIYIRKVKPTKTPSASESPVTEPVKTPSVSESPVTDPAKTPSVSESPVTEPAKTPSVSESPVTDPAKTPSVSESPVTEPVKTPSVSESPVTEPAKTPSVSESPATEPVKTPSVSESPVTEPAKTPSVSESPATEPTIVPTPELASDAYQMVHDIGLGINLGNTMESVSNYKLGSVNAYERYWGAPTTTKAMVDGMKNAGFKTLRIPVAWSNMMSEDGLYTISEDYFNRVEEIMGYALDNDMYVIVNIHYDGGWWARFGSKTESERTQAMEKYKSMWTQIATRFNKYSNKVIFESANEELGTRLNSTEDYSGSGYYESTDDLYELTNKINQTFVDIVRASGGNNATRFLLIAGYDTDITKTCDARYKMPTDTVESRLMVSVHYYSPYGYCDISDASNEGYIASWGSDTEISSLKNDFRNMKLRFVDNGYPVVIGEYNVCDTKNSDGTYTRKTGREIFIRNVCEYAIRNGMCPVLWDTGMGYSRSQCRMSSDIDKELFEGLAVKSESVEVYRPSEEKNEYIWTGSIGVSGWNATDALISDESSNLMMTRTGAVYQIYGIDWTKFVNPYLEIKVNNLISGSGTSYKFSNTVDTTNPYWVFIADSDVKAEGTFTLSNGASLKIDLSKEGLSGYDNIYVGMSAENFSVNVTITIKDGSNQG